MVQTVVSSVLVITDRVRSTTEGYGLTRVCPSICLFTPRGVPGQVQVQAGQGGTLMGGYLPPRSRWGVPGQVPMGVLPLPGPDWGGTLTRVPPSPAGYPHPPGQVQMGGGTRVGQQKEYLLHGGRYASCVHAEGLSCYIVVMELLMLLSAAFDFICVLDSCDIDVNNNERQITVNSLTSRGGSVLLEVEVEIFT